MNSLSVNSWFDTNSSLKTRVSAPCLEEIDNDKDKARKQNNKVYQTSQMKCLAEIFLVAHLYPITATNLSEFYCDFVYSTLNWQANGSKGKNMNAKNRNKRLYSKGKFTE